VKRPNKLLDRDMMNEGCSEAPLDAQTELMKKLATQMKAKIEKAEADGET
jgi:hypothetical protein